MHSKLISAEDALAVISDGMTITTSGFVSIGTPEQLLIALKERFLNGSGPHNLTLLFAAGQGDGKERGLNHLGQPGLLKRVVGGHWGLVPKVAALALDEQIEAYNLPQGCISQLYRDIAAAKPGTLSRVGLHTFADPRQSGGKLNRITQEDLVELLEIGGETYLFYKAMPIDIALLRGTTADAAGNISMEREALTIDNLAMAMAAKNSGGRVIVQVERLSETPLNSRRVAIPGILVDHVVLAAADNHQQTYATPYSAAFSGEQRVPTDSLAPMPLDIRKVIARRAAQELPQSGVINLGIGLPEGVASVANEEGLLEQLTLTAEPGIIGGVPASGLDFGAAVNADAVIDQNQQFDFYEGGGLDMACLGMAQCDAKGHVNVSRFGKRLAGAGGFINISQNAAKLVFTGTFTTGGLEVAIRDGRLEIVKEGRMRKFIQEVEQITFNGEYAETLGQEVLYVTERCVFHLTANGLELTEIAPGVDLQTDILDRMDFQPQMGEIRLMDERLFR